MNDRRIQGSDRDDPDANDTVLRVEHDETELLDRAGAVLWQEIRGEVAWASPPTWWAINRMFLRRTVRFV